MALVFQSLTFDTPVPAAAAIAARVTELLGLPVIVRESLPQIRDNFYDLHAELAFERYPKSPIELTAYRPGAVREQLRQSGIDASPIAHLVQGANDPPGAQTLYLQAHVGQDPTLLYATTIALESLGGRPADPIPADARRDCGRRITPDELRRRHRKSNRRAALTLAAGALLLPIVAFTCFIKLLNRPATPRRT